MARILVVDDDDGIVTFLIDLLASEGHEARGGYGESMIQAAVDWQPDVIFLDLMMPGLDGHAFHRRLQADPRTRAIPVVVMSADYHLREHRGRLTVQGFLAKPFDIVDLLDWVDRLAEASRLAGDSHDAATNALGAGSGV
jgi:twitching motility two-component system response regulator PilH